MKSLAPLLAATLLAAACGQALAGTPIDEKRSESTCSVTVLPVPVAPVTRP